MKTYCCKAFEQQVVQPACKHHTKMVCPDHIIVDNGLPINSWDTRYILPVKDGGESFYRIHYCPFCGKNLEERPEITPEQAAQIRRDLFTDAAVKYLASRQHTWTTAEIEEVVKLLERVRG